MSRFTVRYSFFHFFVFFCEYLCEIVCLKNKKHFLGNKTTELGNKRKGKGNRMEKLRKVRHIQSGMTLEIWDTYQVRDNKSMLRYEFSNSDGSILFAGRDFYCSARVAIDSDECLLSLLGFLTLKQGDTDSTYFDEYTEEQLAFTDSDECEQINLDVHDIEDGETVFCARFEYAS